MLLMPYGGCACGCEICATICMCCTAAPWDRELRATPGLSNWASRLVKKRRGVHASALGWAAHGSGGKAAHDHQCVAHGRLQAVDGKPRVLLVPAVMRKGMPCLRAAGCLCVCWSDGFNLASKR